MFHGIDFIYFSAGTLVSEGTTWSKAVHMAILYACCMYTMSCRNMKLITRINGGVLKCIYFRVPLYTSNFIRGNCVYVPVTHKLSFGSMVKLLTCANQLHNFYTKVSGVLIWVIFTQITPNGNEI